MTWKPHVTVAAIAEREGRFLMIEEAVDGKRVYNQPAGHLDPGESLVEAVIRETFEEAAWTFEPEALVGIQLWRNPENGESYLRFSFCGACLEHHPQQPLDQGIEQAVWLSRDELANKPQKLRSPMVLRSIDDYLAGQRYSLDILAHIAPGLGL